MTTFKEAQRSRSKAVARSKRAHKVPTEDQEQITLMSWAHHVKFGNGRLSDYLIHIPNGGSRNVIEAAKFKKMGVKAGVPDLQLLVPVVSYLFFSLSRFLASLWASANVSTRSSILSICPTLGAFGGVYV